MELVNGIETRKAGDDEFLLQYYKISGKETVESDAGQMNTGTHQEVIQRYYESGTVDFIHDKLSLGVRIPYATFPKGSMDSVRHWFGDLVASQFILTKLPFSPPSEVQPIWEWSDLVQRRLLSRNDTQTKVRGVREVGMRLQITLGSGSYWETASTMGSEGLRFGLTDEQIEKQRKILKPGELEALQQLDNKLCQNFGQITVREAILGMTDGRLPTYDEQFYSHVIGVSVIVVTEDDHFILVSRGKGTSVNLGINVTASGAADWAGIEDYTGDLRAYLEAEMLRELEEETGIKSNEGQLKIVGTVRELTRGGSPEWLAVFHFNGSSMEAVQIMALHAEQSGNDAGEWDEQVYVLSIQQVRDILKHPEGDRVIQHKALCNLALALC